MAKDTYIKIFEQRGNTIALWLCCGSKKIRPVKKNKDNYNRAINKEDYTFNQIMTYKKPIHGITEPSRKFHAPKPEIDYRTKEGYRLYLRTKHWVEFRKEIMMGEPKCRVCGATSHLNVHHLNYDCLFKENYTDVIILCEEHHQDIHDYLKGKGVGPNDKLYKQLIDWQKYNIGVIDAGAYI